MATEKQVTDHPNRSGAGKKSVEQAQSPGEACRCKETALMKPRQLLQIMIDDLSFWKKAKKGKPGA